MGGLLLVPYLSHSQTLNPLSYPSTPQINESLKTKTNHLTGFNFLFKVIKKKVSMGHLGGRLHAQQGVYFSLSLSPSAPPPPSCSQECAPLL